MKVRNSIKAFKKQRRFQRVNNPSDLFQLLFPQAIGITPFDIQPTSPLYVPRTGLLKINKIYKLTLSIFQILSIEFYGLFSYPPMLQSISNIPVVQNPSSNLQIIHISTGFITLATI
jgi:hypothetical protein